jgi:hypothetical protein
MNKIKMTIEQKARQLKLTNILFDRLLTHREQGEQDFLYLLFKYQEQGKTKEDLKRHINKLYAANKSIAQADKKRIGLTNYQIDILATEPILQSDKNVLYSFFNCAYDYLNN